MVRGGELSFRCGVNGNKCGAKVSFCNSKIVYSTNLSHDSELVQILATCTVTCPLDDTPPSAVTEVTRDFAGLGVLIENKGKISADGLIRQTEHTAKANAVIALLGSCAGAIADNKG